MILPEPVDREGSVTYDRVHSERLYRSFCVTKTCTNATWLLPDEFDRLLKGEATSRMCNKCFREAAVERVNGGRSRDRGFRA